MAAPTYNLNNLPPDSVLNHKIFNADYLLQQGINFFHFILQKRTLSVLDTIFTLLSLFFVTLIIYCCIRMFEIRRKEHAHLHQELEEFAHHQHERELKKEASREVSHNERWLRVLRYISSISASDWKLAVIEADSMLDALLTQLGYKGETIAEKLKSAGEGNFKGLSTAWEVHAIRNRIAHDSSGFELSSHEANRILALYESVFRQYGYV